jgi:ABC-type branched-subunit amino acid transport system substrate-binding protein
MVRVRSAVAILVAAALVFAACSDDKKTATTTASSSAAPAALTASFRGITATEIKIGVVFVDFPCLTEKGFLDFTQGPAEDIVNALVADINKHNGIGGRQVKLVIKKICPLDPTQTSAACTSLTDDEQVFAVIGIYDTPPSDGAQQLCIAKDKQTVLIDELTTGKTIEGATPGLLLTPHIAPERQLKALLSLLKQKDTLKGKTVALLADQNNEESAKKAVGDFTTAAGLKTGDTGVLTITNDDTTAAQALLDSFIEKWKEQGVDTLVMSGLLVSAKQFVEKIKKALPNILLVSDNSGTGEQANAEVEAGVSPNPYEGMITLSGLSDDETFLLPGMQACVKTYEAKTGDKVIAPKDLKAGADGVTVKTFEGLGDRCDELAILKAGLEKAGPNPTNDLWVAAINSLGKVNLATHSLASLGSGKYDADDGFRLSTWDSSIPPRGDFKPSSTELIDVTK